MCIRDRTGGGSGGPAPATKYSTTFNNASWILASPDYTFTVTAATHGMGTAPMVVVYEGTTTFEQVITAVDVNGSGDVTLKVSDVPDNRFTGLIIIE
jgi:hypothetical protein